MAGPFKVRRHGFSVGFSDVEAAALRRVAEELQQALEPQHLDEPQMKRLFPPAYPDDPKLQDEFLRMTQDELVARKRNASRAVIDSIDGGRIKRGTFSAELSEDQAQAWLGVINDARLVLGTRIDVTEDMDPEPSDASDPLAAAHNLYVYLSGLQWYLIDAMSESAGLGPSDTPMA